MTASPEQAFSAAFEDLYPEVVRYFLRRSVPMEDAHELAADVFVVAWRRWDDATRAELRPWLFQTAKNLLRNFERKTWRRGEVVLRENEAETTEQRPAHEESVDILRALKALSERDQEVLRLAAWEGLTPAEIGRVLDCSPSTASVRLHRARQRLRGQLDSDPAMERKEDHDG